MGDYRVDPHRVMGVLTGVDDGGAGIADAIAEIDALTSEGPSLSVDGRRAISAAWSDVLGDHEVSR